MGTPPPVESPHAQADGDGGSKAPKIGGLSTLKGLILYAAVLTFAGLYIYFIDRIFCASGKPPELDPTAIKAAAALAGVLGSAFALEIGTPTADRATNARLKEDFDKAYPGDETPPATARKLPRTKARIRQALSLEPKDTGSASWPKTFGIWAYAIVAGSVALTYVLKSGETPDAIKALAVAFGGYIVVLINTAYGLTTTT